MATFSRRAADVGDVHVVSLAGELDMATADGLCEWLVDLAGSAVVIDLSELTFLDSSGIASLVRARREIERDGSELKLTRPRHNVERVLDIVGLGPWVTDWEPTWESGLTS